MKKDKVREVVCISVAKYLREHNWDIQADLSVEDCVPMNGGPHIED